MLLELKFRNELQNKAAFPTLARSGHFEETCCSLLKETLGTFADFRKNLNMFGLTELVIIQERETAQGFLLYTEVKSRDKHGSSCSAFEEYPSVQVKVY